MSTKHALVLEHAETPSRSRVRKIIGQSHVAPNFRMKPGYLYTVVRAISARVNQNYDGWPSNELREAAHTFVGKPVFVNHENFDPDQARGVVVASRYRENGNDKFIETVMEVDAQRFPKLAKEIKEGGLDSVSMGAEAGFTICSACGNKAEDVPDMCDHVLYHKGEKIPVRNRRTGKVEHKLVYESCHKLSFFELSYVFDPADETAVASKVIMAGKGFRKGAPFAEYDDFDDCKSKNSDKGDSDAYCGEIKHRTEDKKTAGATEDYLKQLEDGSLDDNVKELPTGPAVGGGPSRAQTKWLQKKRGSADEFEYPGKQASVSELKRIARARAMKLAWGETEAPAQVDTLREEGTAPEDDNDDFHHYVDSPQELSMPDLAAAGRADDQAEAQGQGADDGVPDPQAQATTPGGPPAVVEGPAQEPTQPYIELKIPLPPQQDPAAPGAPAPGQQPVPMQAFARVAAASGAELAFFERYFGHRVADWRDAIEAGRSFTPEEHADFNRQSALLTLENIASGSRTSRNHVKGTANMARSTLASRRKTAGTQHFAEGPYTDGGDVSRNDQGEQEEAFIVETPSGDSTPLPDDDKDNISNTEGNLVADEAYAHSLTAKLRKQEAALRATAAEYARITKGGTLRKRADEYAGGPKAEVVNPTVQDSESEALTGDDFESASPDPATRTDPGAKESSLQAFKTFDKWLTSSTGKSSREHSERNIKRAAKQFADHNGIPVTAMFPALGIVLREARKVEAAKKGTKPMRKRAVDLETAAPDERVSVPEPVENTTDEEAQASQFDEKGFGNNAGDNLADPDLGTGQNFAPGEAPSRSARKADGILAIRCAEAMIAAGLEENTRERKYALAAEFEKMNRGLILDRTALAERFAMVRHADRQKVASGRTRGAASLPQGIGQGGVQPRTASTRRVADNDPINDYTMFG